MRRLLPALLAVLALLGCGVPQDDAPRALERDAAPFRFFERDVAPPPQGELQVELWFVQGDRPVPLPRPLELPGSPQQVLEQLLLGPTQAELAAGVSSAIPGTVELVDLEVTDDIAVVTLEGLNEQVQVPAFAQIVATLDGRPSIEGVRFRTPDGGDLPVPRGEGGLVSGPLTRDDYAVLLGLAPPPNGPPAEPAPAVEPAAVQPAPAGVQSAPAGVQSTPAGVQPTPAGVQPAPSGEQAPVPAGG